MGGIEGELEEEGVFARKLQILAAYHSHHISRLTKLYQNALPDHIPSP